MRGDQVVHLLVLVGELCVLFAGNLFLFEFGLLLLLFEFLLGFRLQLLQLFFVALDSVLLLVNLALQHARCFEHVFVMHCNELRALVDIFLEIVEAERALLKRVVEIRDFVTLVDRLLLDKLICHS